MEKEQKMDEVEAEMKLTMSHAEAREKLEKERDIYERQTDELHELNINVKELIMNLSTSFNSIRAIKNIPDILNSVGLSDDAKNKVNAQIAEIVKEQVESIKREGDKQKERVNDSNKVSAPLSVVTIISVTLVDFLLFFGGLIVANGDLVQSEWLNDYIVRMEWIWGGSVAFFVLGFYLWHRYVS